MMYVRWKTGTSLRCVEVAHSGAAQSPIIDRVWAAHGNLCQPFCEYYVWRTVRAMKKHVKQSVCVSLLMLIVKMGSQHQCPDVPAIFCNDFIHSRVIRSQLRNLSFQGTQLRSHNSFRPFRILATVVFKPCKLWPQKQSKGHNNRRAAVFLKHCSCGLIGAAPSRYCEKQTDGCQKELKLFKANLPTRPGPSHVVAVALPRR